MVAYAVTGKIVNRDGSCEMAKWMSRERKKDSSGCFGQESRKKNRQHRVKQQRNNSGERCSSAKKARNNCFR